MKRYKDLVGDLHDNFAGRERLEWSNFWYDRTNELVDRRILLIGDSTARMVRSAFAEKTGYAVDLLGVSSGMHDLFFQKLVDIFFCSTQYHYDAIYIQIGHHSRINDNGEPYGEKDYERYEHDLLALIEYVSQYCENIILLTIFYSVVPPTRHLKGVWHRIEDFFRHFRPEKYDESINSVKERKNSIIKEVANKQGLKCCDINSLMMNLQNGIYKKYIHADHIHFEDSAKEYIVNEYIKLL